MKKGDTVVYNQQHYLYLQGIGRWPNKHIPRRDYTGKVLEVVVGTRPDALGTRISWRYGQISWHFSCSLEVVTPT